MPIRIDNPFEDPTLELDPKVNPYLEKMRHGQQSGEITLLFGPALKPWVNKWKEFFAERHQPVEKLVLEVGCHKGEVLQLMSKAHPDTGFIGIDITFKRVVHTAQKAKAAGLSNMLSLLCNGRGLDRVFGPEELDGAVIFFPDPWVRKKRQRKNRLLDEDFLAKLHRSLKPGAFLWVKTDDGPYMEDIKIAAKAQGFTPYSPEGSEQASGILSETYTSRFERHFDSKGVDSHNCCWVKA